MISSTENPFNNKDALQNIKNERITIDINYSLMITRLLSCSAMGNDCVFQFESTGMKRYLGAAKQV